MILLTNYFEEPDILAVVRELKIRLLPKPYMLKMKFRLTLEVASDDSSFE